MGLRSYIIRRLLLMIPTLIGVTLLIFAVIQLFSPTQRASLFVRDVRGLDQIETIIQKYHLNDPVYIQYFFWMSEVVQGNLGWSVTMRMPVLNALLQAAPATIEVVMFSIPLIVFLGIWLGVLSATHRDKPVDHATRILSIVGWSLPTFWLGMLLLAVFFGWWGMFPPGRLDQNIDLEGFVQYTGLYSIDGLLNARLDVTLNALEHIVLPTLTLTAVIIALIVRVMRSSMLEALGKGYITAARAKGLKMNDVINKHARRNALIPAITISGLLAAGLLTGVVITETVFIYKGLGFLAARAAIQLDIPMVLGFALLVGIIFVVANLIVDITYAYVDPRIRLD